MNNNYIGLKLTGFQGEKIEVVSFLEKFNMFMYTETNKNGITLTGRLMKEEDIKNLIDNQSKITESENKMKQIHDQQEQKQQEQQEEYNNVYGYCDNMKPVTKGKILATLNKTTKHNKKVMTRKEFIKTLLNEGYTPVIIDKMVSSDRKINLERIVKYKYDVPALQLGTEFYTVTKTEYDFALYLQSVSIPA